MVGGEATQATLYQQQLAYISSHFGINITHPITSLGSGDRWPISVKLNPKIPGHFGMMPQAFIQSHFSPVPHQNHCIELQQGYKPSRPTMRVCNPQGQMMEISQPDHPWEDISHDPTEIFYEEDGTISTPRKVIIVEPITITPGSVNLTQKAPPLFGSQYDWDSLTLERLDLWGNDNVEMEEDEEELAQQLRAEKRKRGLRSPSPTAGYVHPAGAVADLVAIANGKF